MLARIGVSKQQIFTVAEKIAATGQLPTAVKVRQILTTGSIVTIQKYLKEWKKNCFTQIITKTDSNVNHQNNNAELIETHRILEQALNKQTIQNEYYAEELINAEKTIIALKAANHKLLLANQELQLELKEVKAIKITLEQVNQAIQTRLEVNDNALVNKQKLLIDELQQELKDLNAKSMAAIRELSSQGHEVLMQEKVNAINLQAKTDTLYKELAESKKQLELAKVRAHVQNQALQRQINLQQQILKKYISPEDLQTFNQDPELLGLEEPYGQ